MVDMCVVVSFKFHNMSSSFCKTDLCTHECTTGIHKF